MAWSIEYDNHYKNLTEVCSFPLVVRRHVSLAFLVTLWITYVHFTVHPSELVEVVIMNVTF